MASAQTTRTRARDSDRTDTCQILDTALAEGQLSMAEHADRVKAATRATSLGDLRALVSDLQTASAPVQLPALQKPAIVGPRATWALRLVTVGVLVALGVGIGWGLFGNTRPLFGMTPDPGARPDGIAPVVLDPPRQLHSLGGLDGLFAQMRAKFGDTVGYRLVIYPEYAVLARPDPADARRTLNFTYRGGWDDPSAEPRAADVVAVDLDKFDTRAIVGVLRGAPQTLTINPAEVRSTYLIVEPAKDPTAPGAVSISIYVSSEFGSGYIETGPDGSVKRINYPSS